MAEFDSVDSELDDFIESEYGRILVDEYGQATAQFYINGLTALQSELERLVQTDDKILVTIGNVTVDCGHADIVGILDDALTEAIQAMLTEAL